MLRDLAARTAAQARSLGFEDVGLVRDERGEYGIRFRGKQAPGKTRPEPRYVYDFEDWADEYLD